MLQEELFIKFAEFEEKVKELDRARAIYKYALDHIPRAQADTVYRRFVAFEKQHGDRDGIEVRCRCCCWLRPWYIFAGCLHARPLQLACVSSNSLEIVP